MWKPPRTGLNAHKPHKPTKPRVTSGRKPWSTGFFMQLSQMCQGQGSPMSTVTYVYPGIAGQPLDICAVIGPGGLDICPIIGPETAFLDSILPGFGGVFKLQMTVLSIPAYHRIIW